MRVFLVSILGLGLCVIAGADNLMKNGDFGNGTAGWSIVTKQPTVVEPQTDDGAPAQALRVNVATDGGSSYGEIRTKVKAKPNHLYRLSAMMKSSKARLGLLQVKLREQRREFKRLKSKDSGSSWERVTLEFSSENADEIQVLCRYRQSAEHNWVGESVWFGDVKLEDLGRDPEAAPAATLAAGALAIAKEKTRKYVAPAAVTGTDMYVTPEGAGSMDGSSWENARAGNGDGALQAAWDSTGLGRRCLVGSGVYEQQSLTIATGGTDRYTAVRLVGVDTGGGLPVFRSTFDRHTPDKGQKFVSLEADVDYVGIQNVQVERYQIVLVAQGRNVGLEILNVDVKDVRDTFVIVGGARETDPLDATHDLLIKGCEVVGFTKRAVRISGGVYQARIVDCLADAGGKAHATERFQMGYHLSGGSGNIASHDITFVNCEARNSYDDNGDKYWNADGFAAERGTYNVSFYNCRAFDCTDGGWDVKTLNPVLVNCVSMRNKRNYRFWSRGGATLINCLGAYAKMWGGTGTAAGLHVCGGGTVQAISCTFAFNGIQVDVDGDTHGGPACHAELVDSVLVAPEGSHLVTTEEKTTAGNQGTVMFQVGDAEGVDPVLEGAEVEWQGKGAAFRSTAFPDKGFGGQ